VVHEYLLHFLKLKLNSCQHASLKFKLTATNLAISLEYVSNLVTSIHQVVPFIVILAIHLTLFHILFFLKSLALLAFQMVSSAGFSAM
jgi:hypothetical protein